MSDSSTNSSSSRPVSLVTVLAIFAGFALFLVLVLYKYLPSQTGVAAASDDGIHTVEQRTKTLRDLRKAQGEQATTYGWVDQKAGIVRLPLDRAMELTAQQYGATRK